MPRDTIFQMTGSTVRFGAGASRYYVKNGGNDMESGLSWATAWATVGKSLAVMTAGDSVMVANGNYSERLQTVRSGTAVAPITLVASGDSVFLSCADDLDDSAFTRHPDTATSGSSTAGSRGTFARPASTPSWWMIPIAPASP